MAIILMATEGLPAFAQRFGGGIHPHVGGFHAGGFHPQHALPGGNFGAGSVVHHSSLPTNHPHLPSIHPGSGGISHRDFSNIHPGGGDAGIHELPHMRPGGDGTRFSPSHFRDFDPNHARQLLQEHGFDKPSDLRRVLQEKGLHSPDDVRKTLADRNNRYRDTLHQALSQRDFDPSKIDRSKLNETVRNRLNNHPITIDNSRHFNDHPENNVMKWDSIHQVRQQFVDNHPNWHNYWDHDWYTRHPGAWYPPHPVMPPAWWGPPPAWDHTWGWLTAGFVTGAVADAVLTPFSYNYGTNVYYSDGMVYTNGVPYVSAEEYYDQACDLAETGDTVVTSGATNITMNVDGSAPQAAPPQETVQADTEEWLPMGSYAILKDPDDKDCEKIIQLAISKNGKVAGNIVDIDSDETIPVVGSVDPKTQRVAFHAPGHAEVGECGLWNLTQDSLTVLLHFSQDRTEERTLVRLSDPKQLETE